MSWRFHPYRLQGALAREGALLRVELAGGGVGYADLHPWESFGDRPLAEELNALRAGNPTRLGRRALALAQRDGEARRAGRSLWEGLEAPPSHYLLASLAVPDWVVLAQQGYTRLKVKLRRDWSERREVLRELLQSTPSSFKIRFDFNESLSADGLTSFLEETERWHERIDFLEDPTADWREWQAARAGYRVALAADHAAETARGVEVRVLKPAILDPLATAVLEGRLVVTSYLDHPLGQAAAAVAAAELARRYPGRVDVGGLLSQDVYEPNDFSRALPRRGPWFLRPAGTGFGFDEQLAALSWRDA